MITVIIIFNIPGNKDPKVKN